MNTARRATGEGKKAQARLICRLATAADRRQIYHWRHQVYALELGQHAPDPSGALNDELDAGNLYLVLARDDRVRAFISLTPPDLGRYSIDKYLARESCPFAFDDGLWEIRLLTVDPQRRGGPDASILIFAAGRWIEEHGGRHVVLIGRSDLVAYYRKFGVEPFAAPVRSGRVSYVPMHGDLSAILRLARGRYRRGLDRLREKVEWSLDFPFWGEQKCEHGGAFFKAIGETFDTLDRRTEIISADVLDAWFDPAPGVAQALKLDPNWLARTSPPTHAEGLLATLAERRALPATSIVPGAGSSDLIFRAFHAWLKPGSRVLLIEPSYGEYAHLLGTVIGADVQTLQLDPRDDFNLDLEAWSRRLSDGFDLAVLVNPLNPTGQAFPAAALQPLIAAAPATTRLWIDEAYAEYAGSSTSLESLACRLPNLVVCKSLSKVYALSGLRAAYLVAHPQTAAELRRRTPPWPISLPAQIAAVRALSDPEHYAACYRRTHELQAELADGLETLGLHPIRGVINAVLLRLPDGCPSAPQLTRRLAEQGIFVRDLSSLSAVFGERFLRISVRPATEQQRLLDGLASALRA